MITTGAMLALELAQQPLTDDESFLQWVERHANRYLDAARSEERKLQIGIVTALWGADLTTTQDAMMRGSLPEFD